MLRPFCPTVLVSNTANCSDLKTQRILSLLVTNWVKRLEGCELVRTGRSTNLSLTSKGRQADTYPTASWAHRALCVEWMWMRGARSAAGAPAQRSAKKKAETLINAVHPSEVLKTFVGNNRIKSSWWLLKTACKLNYGSGFIYPFKQRNTVTVINHKMRVQGS